MSRTAVLKFSDHVRMAAGVAATTNKAGKVVVQLVDDDQEIFACAAMPPATALLLIDQINKACNAMRRDSVGAAAGRA